MFDMSTDALLKHILDNSSKPLFEHKTKDVKPIKEKRNPILMFNIYQNDDSYKYVFGLPFVENGKIKLFVEEGKRLRLTGEESEFEKFASFEGFDKIYTDFERTKFDKTFELFDDLDIHSARTIFENGSLIIDFKKIKKETFKISIL